MDTLRASSSPHRRLLGLSLLLASACARTVDAGDAPTSDPGPPDERPLLESCEYGLFYANCGGTGEAVVACDRSSGECRWFAGGMVARNHEVSDCPAEALCCHLAPPILTPWAFPSWTPSSPTALLRTQTDLGVLRRVERPITRADPALPISVTLAATPAPIRTDTTCSGVVSPYMTLCVGGEYPVEVGMVGASLVARFAYLGRGSVDVEVMPIPGADGHAARVFTTHDPMDSLSGPLCLGGLGGGTFVGAATLVLDPGSFAAPENAHGVLELDPIEGGHITIEF